MNWIILIPAQFSWTRGQPKPFMASLLGFELVMLGFQNHAMRPVPRKSEIRYIYKVTFGIIHSSLFSYAGRKHVEVWWVLIYFKSIAISCSCHLSVEMSFYLIVCSQTMCSIRTVTQYQQLKIVGPFVVILHSIVGLRVENPRYYHFFQMCYNSKGKGIMVSLCKGCIAFNIRVVGSCLKFREKSKGKVYNTLYLDCII